MSAHAPSPWWTTERGVRNIGGYIVHTNSVFRYEGQNERYEREVKQLESDKQLIAAAPELLSACNLFVEYEQTAENDGMAMMFAYNAVKVAVHAAIAKAVQS